MLWSAVLYDTITTGPTQERPVFWAVLIFGLVTVWLLPSFVPPLILLISLLIAVFPNRIL
jgi:hypothetical protein